MDYIHIILGYWSLQDRALKGDALYPIFIKCSRTLPVKFIGSNPNFHTYIGKLIKSTLAHSNIYVCKFVEDLKSIPPVHTTS